METKGLRERRRLKVESLLLSLSTPNSRKKNLICSSSLMILCRLLKLLQACEHMCIFSSGEGLLTLSC